LVDNNCEKSIQSSIHYIHSVAETYITFITCENIAFFYAIVHSNAALLLKALEVFVNQPKWIKKTNLCYNKLVLVWPKLVSVFTVSLGKGSS
jgi:hypothetical protein